MIIPVGIISKKLLIQDTTLALLRNISYPNAPDAEALLF